MMTKEILIDLIAILTIHYIADFVMQTNEQATNKSSSILWLLYHTITYSLVWFLLSFCYFFTSGNNDAIIITFKFAVINFVFHTITDYFTSKKVSKLFKNNVFYTKPFNFDAFSFIGLDQLLHYTQLFLTYYLII